MYMKYFTATVSFVVVFIFAFILAGWFLMPHLPPVTSGPDRTISALEMEYWTMNWIGVALGVILGGLSARSTMKKANKKKIQKA